MGDLDKVSNLLGYENVFQVFNQPKWKLEIVVQYFSKYTTKASQLHWCI